MAGKSKKRMVKTTDGKTVQIKPMDAAAALVRTTDGAVVRVKLMDRAPRKKVATTDGSVVTVKLMDRVPVRRVPTTDKGILYVRPMDRVRSLGGKRSTQSVKTMDGRVIQVKSTKEKK